MHLGSRLLRNVSQIEHAKIPIRQESESDSLNALIIKVHVKALSACKVKFYTLITYTQIFQEIKALIKPLYKIFRNVQIMQTGQPV